MNAYWNGEPALAEQVVVTVPEWRDGDPPAAWWEPFAGTERRAVIVVYNNDRFILDDEDGSGYQKVTQGFGGPSWPHRSLPIRSRVVA